MKAAIFGILLILFSATAFAQNKAPTFANCEADLTGSQGKIVTSSTLTWTYIDKAHADGSVLLSSIRNVSDYSYQVVRFDGENFRSYELMKDHYLPAEWDFAIRARRALAYQTIQTSKTTEVKVRDLKNDRVFTLNLGQVENYVSWLKGLITGQRQEPLKPVIAVSPSARFLVAVDQAGAGLRLDLDFGRVEEVSAPSGWDRAKQLIVEDDGQLQARTQQASVSRGRFQATVGSVDSTMQIHITILDNQTGAPKQILVDGSKLLNNQYISVGAVVSPDGRKVLVHPLQALGPTPEHNVGLVFDTTNEALIEKIRSNKGIVWQAVFSSDSNAIVADFMTYGKSRYIEFVKLPKKSDQKKYPVTF